MLTIKDTLKTTYPDPVQDIINQLGTQVLDPGTENTALQARIDALSADDLCGDQTVTNKELAQCCLSGLWLAANYLDTSHDISQGCPSNTGSYWHGIMHRREPDYSNAAYWFRKVGDHPLFAELPTAIADAVSDASPELQALAQKWDPFDFNAVCERNLGGGAEESLCQDIQAIEWAMLFDYSYQGAMA